MKKILLSCACCLLAVGLLAGCNNEEEVVTPDEPDTTVPSTGGDDGGSTDGGEGGTKEMVFGFEVDGVMNYIDGGTISGYAYEGTLTTDLAKAVRITLEESETEGAYYVSFDNGGTTNWITIVDNNGHTNFGYVTTKSLLYYNAEYECWGDETLDYFLCYNSAYECFYCSALSSYGPDSTKPSPIATLYYTDGSVVSGLKGYTYSAPAPTEITISGLSYVLVGETTQLTASVNAGANPSVNWTIALPEGVTEGEVVSTYASIDGNGMVTGISAYTGLVVTATSAVDTSVSANFTINVIEVALPKTDEEADTTYKLGALDTNDYVYRWFTGETTGSTFLLAGDSYDAAADIYRTEQNIPNVSYAYTLSLMVEDELVYISNNGSSTSVTLSSSPCIWVWNAELAVYAQGSESGRSLVLYTSKVANEETKEETVTYSFRAYTQTETNLAYPHAALYEEEAVVATVSGITVTAEDGATSVEVGKTLQLTATVSPDDADPRVTWSSSNDEYATVDDNGLVTGVAVCDSVTITATSVANSSVTGTIQIAVTEIEPLPEGMIGYFDFSTYSGTSNTIITEDDALDDFWYSPDYSELYLGAREHDTVYFGNGTGGAFENTKEYLKFGSGSGASAVDGLLQLKFAVGTSISEVVVTAHSWLTTETDTLTINGTTQNCSQSGSVEALTYTITDDWTYLLTMESSGRVFVQTIEIYGTYSEEFDTPTEITISAEGIEDALNVGESVDVSVSWTEGTLLDIDTLVWESKDITGEGVAEVSNSLTGGTIRATGSGTAEITATSEDGVTSNTLSIEVIDVLESSETFIISEINHGQSGNTDSATLIGHEVSITIANNGGSTKPNWYTGEIRMYPKNTITFTPLYDEAPISKIEIIYDGSYYGNDYDAFTDANGNEVGTISRDKASGGTITISDITSSGALTYTLYADENHSSNSGGTQLRVTAFVVYYALTV